MTEVPKSFSHFITNVCAIIGGVFTVRTSVLTSTILLLHCVSNICFEHMHVLPICIYFLFQVAGILDSILHTAVRLIKKVELGKQF